MIDNDEAWWFMEKFQSQPPPPRRQDQPAPPSPYTSDPPWFSGQAHQRLPTRPAFPSRPENGHIISFLRSAVKAGPQKTPEPTGPCSLSARHRLDRSVVIRLCRIPHPPENTACTSYPFRLPWGKTSETADAGQRVTWPALSGL